MDDRDEWREREKERERERESGKSVLAARIDDHHDIALRAGKKGARPAEVGALASVFEKSATELKQSKLLKCKQTLQIATFNVRTLNRIGQLPELIA